MLHLIVYQHQDLGHAVRKHGSKPITTGGDKEMCCCGMCGQLRIKSCKVDVLDSGGKDIR